MRALFTLIGKVAATEHTHAAVDAIDGHHGFDDVMTVREHRGPIQSPAPAKDFDISFSGIAFAPHWPEKARILNRIAALDDPSLKIRINHGYVDETSYRDSFRLSKFVPLINRMGFSLNQDRTTESLHYGV